MLSRDELSHAAIGRGLEPDDRTVDVLISRLSRKIEADPKRPRIIVTLPGEGYKFAVRSQTVTTPVAPDVLNPVMPGTAVAGMTAGDAPAPNSEPVVRDTTAGTPTEETAAQPASARPRRGQSHRALALALTSGYRAQRRGSRDEAALIAIERCSDMARSPCLLVSVDGMWIVALPQSARIAGPFTLAGEPDMSDAERRRIAEVYAAKDWRALAKGGPARWYAAAGRQTEAAAVEDVLKACRAGGPECRLHAIGNWRVDVDAKRADGHD